MRCEGVLPAKERVAISAPPLGCRQVVRHRFLVPAFPGSNPGTPAILSGQHLPVDFAARSASHHSSVLQVSTACDVLRS